MTQTASVRPNIRQKRPPPARRNAPVYDFATYDMPWTVILHTLKHMDSVTQIYHAIFIFGRVLPTMTMGVGIYGSLSGIATAKSAEDIKYWECDTKHVGCDILCYNRFLPLMPARLLQFLLLFTMFPDIFFLLYFARQESEHQREIKVANDHTASNLIKEKYKATERTNKTRMNLFKNMAVPVLYNTNIAIAKTVCYATKMVLEIIFLFIYNWLLQYQYNQRIFRTGNTGWKLIDIRAYVAPEFYECQAAQEVNNTCSNGGEMDNQITTCYNVRSYEKSYFNYYMACLHIVSILFLVYVNIKLARGHIIKKWKKEEKYFELENMDEKRPLKID